MDTCAELDLRLSSVPMSSRTGRPGAATPSLDELPFSPALRALAERAEPRRYRKGVLLIQEGDQGDTLYIVLSGRVRAFSQGDNEREITYGVYGPGEYVGEISLDGGPRSASVITVEPTACVVIPRQTLLLHIAQYPEFAFELLAKVIRRARAATLSAKQLALNDVYGRLRALLESLAEAQPDGTRQVGERLTHQDMANRLGCSREMVSRLMKDLEEGGYVAVNGHTLVLPRALPARW
ncbi:transcriptional regulator, Crp/Fnr family [Leptothrix cholodnii SP-6]|uniref:Transcriptional regulator, Crp/Fnr family n=2 Tax=Leptothrix cholodnii TaxID=34029 RepID=B1XXN2_LEPCP|nr:transcriptional regulator, Crp/Fnr family [Leptothrix cholodnii SP-6]